VWVGTSSVARVAARPSGRVDRHRRPDGRERSGHINPALYKVAADPTKYATDFFDVTIGNIRPQSIQFIRLTGWDAVTGLARPSRHLLPIRRGCLPALIGGAVAL